MDQKLTKWIDIFSIGSHTDSGGHVWHVAAQDLDRLVNTFDEAERRVPLVLGHPKTHDPAWGWVQTLRRQGDTLQACFRQVPEELEKAVEAGRYKNISIHVGRDGKLRHVGLLGAKQPAVAGLAPVEFSDAEEGATYEFSQEETNVNEEQLKAKIAELEAKVAELEKRLAEAQAGKEKSEAEFAEYKTAQTKAARAARVDQLVKDGKILPAERVQHLSFAEALGSASMEMDFAEENGAKAKVSAEEAYWRNLEKRKENHHGMFGELATEERYGNPGQETAAYEDLSGKA